MIEHGNTLGFDSAFCTHPKSVDTLSKYPAPGGYKGWIRRDETTQLALFPRPRRPAKTDGYVPDGKKSRTG